MAVIVNIFGEFALKMFLHREINLGGTRRNIGISRRRHGLIAANFMPRRMMFAQKRSGKST
jgi:hypothetical protein